MKKQANPTKRIFNRRARHDYVLGESFVVGIMLLGTETKALRMGHGNLQGAYVTLKDNAPWLINATINGTKGVLITEEDQTRSRKLLAKQKEITKLQAAKDQGLTIIPLEIITQGRYIKVRISTGKGRRQYDKRNVLKKRDAERHMRSELKNQQHNRSSYST